MDRTISLLKDAGVTLDQMLELLLQIKMLATTAPQQARLILNQDIPLANAMLQSLLAMKVVDPAVLVQQIITLQANVAAAHAAASGRFPVPPAPTHPDPRSSAVREPVPGVAAAAPPPAAPTFDISNVDEQTMIRGIMSLTPDQIAAMTPQEQAAIALIRQQFAGRI